jgi:methylated-DNA-protein-cysteine methyltransferase-like protein
MDELWSLIRSIPSGRVSSYGTVGQHLKHPTTGRIVGRWLTNCPENVPWWRVVGFNGRLPIAKQGIGLENLQADLLTKEGVEVVDGKIDMRRFGCFDLIL